MPVETDRLLTALDELEAALTVNEERSAAMRARIAQIRELRRSGQAYREIVTGEQRPLIVELLTQTVNSLESAGARVRRHEAQFLHREGMTMDAIADLFGVTRQRVSALLRDRQAATG